MAALPHVAIAGLLVCAGAPAWAAELDAFIDPGSESFPFEMKYAKAVIIEYPQGGGLYDELRGKEWTVQGTADATNPGVRELMDKLNMKIANDGSQARIADLDVSYEFDLRARDDHAYIDYQVILKGIIGNHVIAPGFGKVILNHPSSYTPPEAVDLRDSSRTLIDVGWRGMSADGPIIIDGVDINIPLHTLLAREPGAYVYIEGTDAAELLTRELLDADFILETPLVHWHYLFDPTGLGGVADPSAYGIPDELAGSIMTQWAMGETGLREGRQLVMHNSADIVVDQPYSIHTVKQPYLCSIHVIGYGIVGTLDDVEIIGVYTSRTEIAAPYAAGFPPFMLYVLPAAAGLGGAAAVLGVIRRRKERGIRNVRRSRNGIF